MQTFSYSPIGVVHSCFKDKFGIPRQSGLTPHSTAILEFFTPYNRPEAWQGIEGFSRLWIHFLFHTNYTASTKLSARPPRLGGNKKMGIFATRSPFHPNYLGQSVVKLDRIEQQNNKLSLHISGHDLLDQTPILDIKPYIPEYDSYPEANIGWIAQKKMPLRNVQLSNKAYEQIEQLSKYPNLKELIIEILQHDPRTASQKKADQQKTFRIHIYDIDIEWEYYDQYITVLQIIQR